MSISDDAGAATADRHARSGLLPAALRRDLADLNGQFLDLGLHTEAADHPRFGWSEPIRRCLAETDAATRVRMAASPFALFGLELPGGVEAGGLSGVSDAARLTMAAAWHGRCQTFAWQAAFLARRLVESAPLAARIAFGLTATEEVRLAQIRLSQLADIALSPGLVCARWPAHERFWEMLVGAARRDSAAALQWTYCVGLCLYGADASAVLANSARPAARRRSGRRPPC